MSPAERTRFLRALQDDPEFRAEVRRQLLSDELLELPDRFARFAAYVEGFIEEQKIINARVDATLARIETNIARIETSIGILKGNVARRVLRDHHETIWICCNWTSWTYCNAAILLASCAIPEWRTR